MENKSGVSFSFSKTKKPTNLKTSVINESEKTTIDDTEYLTSVVDKEIQSTKAKEEKKELVIPLISKNKWRNPKRPDDLDEEQTSEPEKKKRKKEVHSDDNREKTEGSSVENEAVQELLKEAANEDERWDTRGDEPTVERTVPLLMQNAVPVGFETDEKLDVQLRPDEPEDANYDEVPIEEYGMALLRGMGFKAGEGVGKNQKVFKPIEAVARPKGLGLGADKSKVLQAKSGQTDGKEGTRTGEELAMKRGAFVMVEGGRHRDMYGEVVGLDEDNNRAMVKLAVSKEIISISQNALKLVTKEDYSKYSKYLNKGKTDKYKEDHEKDSKHRHKDNDSDSSNSHKHRHKKNKHKKDNYSDRDSDSYAEHNKKHKKSKHHKHDKHRNGVEDKEYSSNHQKKIRPEDIWLRSHLRVRIVDPEFKKGKYFKSKVVIEDVVSFNSCVVRTEEGKVLEDLSQMQLETVIPRSDPGYVMMLSGKHKNAIGEVLRKDKSSCIATVQLLSDRGTVIETHYDTICEYTGDVSNQADF